jgi:hypothetical protein
MFSWSAACPERSRGADLFTLFTPSFEGSLEGLPPLRRREGHRQVISQGEIAVSVDDGKIRIVFVFVSFCGGPLLVRRFCSEPLSSSISTSTNVCSAMFRHLWAESGADPATHLATRNAGREVLSSGVCISELLSHSHSSLRRYGRRVIPISIPKGNSRFSACRPKGTCPVTRLIVH